MARDFTKNTSNYISFPVNGWGALFHGLPSVSMHCWAYSDSFDTGVNDNALFAAVTGTGAGGQTTAFTFRVDGSGATKLFRVGGRSDGNDAFQARNATSSFTTGAWHSCGGVLDFSGDTITPYFDGVAENGGAATFSSSTFNNRSTGVTVGDAIAATRAPPGGTIEQFDGRIAEFAMWGGDIGAGNFAALADGVSANMIQPMGLFVYVPLFGRYSPEPERRRSVVGTITGTVAQADHPRVLLPHRRQIRRFTAAQLRRYQYLSLLGVS